MTRIGPKSSIASIDVDAQYSFTPHCPNELPVAGGDEIVAELNRQAQYAQYRIGSKEAHPPHALWAATKDKPILTKVVGDNVDVHWPLHCIPGTKGFELIEGLPHPAHYDFFVWKGVEPDMHPYGSCYHDLSETMSTGIIEFLHYKQIKTVIVGGLAIDFCVKITVLQLLKAGFETILNLSACRGLDPITSNQAIKLMREHGAIIIGSSQELQQQSPELTHA